MLRNYLKIAFRNLLKSRSYSFLNIFGLGIGVACAGLIFLWTEDEKGFDTIYPKKSQLYNIRTNQVYDGMVRTFNTSPGPLAPALKTGIPGIVATTRMLASNPLLSVNETSIFSRGSYVDNDFFRMMDLTFVEGNASTAFSQLQNMVITQKLAEQLFGTEKNVVGRTLKFETKDEFIVSGVVKDVPVNSTLQYAWLAPFELAIKERPWLQNWGANSTNTYIELALGTNEANVRTQLNGFLQRENPEQTTRLIMHGMNDWRLRDNFESGKQVGGRIQYVKMFSLIAWIILLIACVNFMNLATARSEKRMREVGVRKVLGAEKKGLVVQFLGESLIVSLLSVGLGLIIISLVLPAFNTIVEKQLQLRPFDPTHISMSLLVAVLCGLVAGSYPALYLSSFNPVFVFKNLRLKNSTAATVRKGLVVLQFSISIILIIGTVVIYQQIQHVKNRELGYDKNSLLSLQVRGDVFKNYEAIRTDMLSSGVVENAGLNSFNTLNIGNNSSNPTWQGKDPNRDILLSSRYIDQGLIPTLKLQLAEGRNFRENSNADSSNIIITESLAKLMGTGSAIGKIIQTPARAEDEPDMNWTVVGVVKDFLYGDMYGTSDPVIFYFKPDYAMYLYVRAKEKVSMPEVLSKLEGIMKRYNPEYPFDYSFVDAQFDAKFKSEMLIGKLSRVFAVLAIIISCLGLFGLSAYTAERRTREIGIRKILGASIPGIARMLSREFIVLVLIAAFIAFPVAWLAMQNWLDNYAYRIEISWLIFLISGLIAIGIAMVTISFQAVKAALANPVKNLRSE